MNGLELSRQYYLAFGKPMLETKFPELVERIAVGLVGEGSDCLGFDDQTSQDHDWGAGFSLWLTDADASQYGKDLQAEYDRLPDLFQGYPKKIPGEMAQGRVGVLKTSDFYRRYTGSSDGPHSLQEWLRVPENFLATATNGQIFADVLGEFTHIRERLLGFYPEDVRLKLIAKRCATIAQAGQYNVPRAIGRGEWVAAQLALAEYCQATCSLVYLLNRRYAPFAKWLHHGIKDLPILNQAYQLLEQVAQTPLVNREVIEERIEQICQLEIEELVRQNLTDHQEAFLGEHWPCILARVEDQELKAMHVFAGGY
jgi:hypothetical protein